MFTLQMAILLSSIVIEQTIFLKLPFVNIPCYTDCIPTQVTQPTFSVNDKKRFVRNLGEFLENVTSRVSDIQKNLD